MITIKNVRNLLGLVETIVIPSETEQSIEAEGKWTLFPAAIDVGANAAANLSNLARKAVDGGVTTVFYLSNFIQNLSIKDVQSQKQKASTELSLNTIGLHNQAYFELGPDTIENLGKFKNQMAAVIIPQNNSLDLPSIDRIFQLAAQEDCIVAFGCDSKTPQKTRQAIEFTEKYSTQLLLLNVSNAQEVGYLREAKKSELLVFSAASVSALQTNDILWEAIYDKTLDLVASGNSAIECDLIFPTLLDGYHAKKISFEGIVALTRTNADKIFQLNYNSDTVLVDLEKVQTAPSGKKLRGWPCYTIMKGHLFVAYV
jgi:dihydroorotase-like cyclic amidohydrolase